LPEGDLAPPPVPTVLDLFNQGLLTRPDTLMGFTGGQTPLYLPSPVDLFIIGKKRAGKTTVARYHALMTALRRGKIVLCDPHMGANDESLATSLEDLIAFYARPAARSPGDVLANVRWFVSEAERRLAGGRYEGGLTLFIDEIASICNPIKEEWVPVAKELIPALELVNIEARKVQMRVIAMTQQPNASRLGGGSEFKNSFSGALIMRVFPQQATMTPLIGKERQLVARLPTGGGYLLDDDGGVTLLQTPNATRAHVQAIVAQLGGRHGPLWPGATVDSSARVVQAEPPPASPPMPVEGLEGSALGLGWAQVDAMLEALEGSETDRRALTDAARKPLLFRAIQQRRRKKLTELVQWLWACGGSTGTYDRAMGLASEWAADWLIQGWTDD
jgi:hypothetical protein